MKDSRSQRIDRAYAALFGRFTGSAEATPPADEVLVGREGHRAYLVDLLISMGRRGSYLITGRRGAGKTCFVEQCIAEYKASVFKRFLRASVGRGVLDRLVVVFTSIGFLLGALMLSEILLLLYEMTRESFAHSLLVWLIIVPLALLLLFPAIYAKELLEACLERVPPFFAGVRKIFRQLILRRSTEKDSPPQGPGASESRFPSVVAFYVVLVLAMVIWHFEPFGAPSLAISRSFSVIAGLYFVVQATSFYECKEKKEVHFVWHTLGKKLRRLKQRAPGWNPALPLYGFLATLYLFFGPGLVEKLSPESEFGANISFGIFLLGLGFLLRAHHVRRLFKEGVDPSALREAARRGSLNYIFIGAGLTLLGFGLWSFTMKNSPLPQIIGPLAATAVFLAFYIVCSLTHFKSSDWSGRPRHIPISFRAKPQYLFCLKALVSIIVAFHLTEPILTPIYRTAVNLPAVSSFYKTYETRFLANADKEEEINKNQRLHSEVSIWRLAAQNRLQLFHGSYERTCWLLSVLLGMLVLYFIEYEWIVRPSIGPREDRALDPAARTLPQRQEVTDRPEEWRCNRRLAELSFPWMIYNVWLPVLVISVNLGFEKLDHRRVVQTMLLGMRESYHRTFLAWNSGLATFGRIIGFLFVIVLVTLADEAWFKLPSLGKGVLDSSSTGTVPVFSPSRTASAPVTENENDNPICDAVHSKTNVAVKLPNVICDLGGDRFLQLLYFNLLPRSFGRIKVDEHYEGLLHDDMLFYRIVPFADARIEVAVDSRSPSQLILLRKGPYFCVYHIFLVLLFLFGGRWLLARTPLLPYRQNLQRIDDVLDSLSSYTRVTTRRNLWKPAQWVYGFFGDERERQTERAPVDPRTVELAFLRILEEVQKGGLGLPASSRDYFSLPTPEITFIFDELDKLGVRVDPETSTPEVIADEQLEILNAERRRSMALLSLLSDLKNLLSSGNARFIFVGGRNLYDEWLADQTARQPLLTNIFNAQIYLPSLMTDYDFARARLEGRRLDQRVAEYLAHQQRRAMIMYRRWARKRWRPSYGLTVQRRSPERFVQENLTAEEMALPLCPEILRYVQTGDPVDRREAETFVWDFIRFLTYRSMGNPKKLKELLASFVRPVGRVMHRPAVEKELLPCRHVLQFGDAEIFRIQLLESVYRHLTIAFEERLTTRDDKLAVSVFFLTDFLFKFHRRAFSWSNLERVDELVHIHRAPDLREILSEIVNHCSERFLHRILNGLYSYRFRSDMAREIEYLSRHSAEEMAAFNFTLDESQSLKTFYSVALKTAGSENYGLVAGLGELYEFDQEFDTARQHYRRAVDILDADLEKQLSGGRGVGVHRILTGHQVGQKDARVFIKWGIVRLRFMMHIGMTFEHARNYENAHTQYRISRSLSRVLLSAYLDETGRQKDNPSLGLSKYRDPFLSSKHPEESRLYVLKNLTVIFQPVFAEAWVSEKIVGSIDTSVSLVERELCELRRVLPFVRDCTTKASTNPANVRSSNFSLITSQLHNKAGDLLFFKGRSAISSCNLADMATAEMAGEKPIGWEGYLLRAHYHYAVGLHDLRRYLYHRRISSEHKFNIAAKPWPTFLPYEWPDFVFRATASGVNDMAEAMQARISLLALFRQISLQDDGVVQVVSQRSGKPNGGTSNDRGLQRMEREAFIDHCSKWFESDSKGPASQRKLQLGNEEITFELGSLDSWFGDWTESDNDTFRDDDVITFREPHSPAARLVMSINLCFVGARYFERGGYPEDAARELLQVCETITHYLWWGRMVETLKIWQRNKQWPSPLKNRFEAWIGRESLQELLNSKIFSEQKSRFFWTYLIDIALDALGDAAKLFRDSRRDEGAALKKTDGTYLIGDKIPPSALTLACSLGLAGQELLGSMSGEQLSPGTRLSKLIKDWTSKDLNSTAELGDLLVKSLGRHRFPMINRLKGLKVLVDNGVIGGCGVSSAVVGWALELLETRTQFVAPLHFTPFDSGVTFALLWLRWMQDRSEENSENADGCRRIFRAAQRDLAISEQMCTQRRCYYEAISDLFYLYDDFNDRNIHVNHALQMAGTELAAILEGCLSLGRN